MRRRKNCSIYHDDILYQNQNFLYDSIEECSYSAKTFENDLISLSKFVYSGRIADEDEYIIMPRFHGAETVSSLDFFFMAQPKVAPN